jgi:hypothetical protein
MNTLIKSPPPQAPLSSHNAYTSWPGGVDPSVALFRTDNQKGGRKNTLKKSKKSKKNARKSTRKNNMKGRKNNRR